MSPMLASNRSAESLALPQRQQYLDLKGSVHRKLLNRLNLDARLPDGSRVNAIIPPLAVDGPLLSIRRFPAERLKADDLVTLRALTRPMLDFLAHCVRARMNMLISGGTGAGKTTLLNVLSGFIGDRERIVTIEDAAELQLHQEHVARLETRPPNVEGKGAVRQRQLVINALRMRPDRIVVGE